MQMNDLPDYLKSPKVLQRDKEKKENKESEERQKELLGVESLLKQVEFRLFIMKIRSLCLDANDAPEQRIIKIDLWEQVSDYLKESNFDLYQLTERENYGRYRKK